jgi:microcompartment protein CcmL/EutN
MNKALALIEFDSMATGVLAVDRMLKQAPVALLRCGTVHPGKYLALVGGTVAATEEAHAVGVELARQNGCLIDEVLLPDPHGALEPGLVGGRKEPAGDTLAVFETANSPAMLRILDGVLKRVPVQLDKLRLADDLGGKALAVLDGELPDVQQAVEIAGELGAADEGSLLLGASITARLDDTLRKVLGETTMFANCRNWTLEGAEKLED